MAAEQVTLAGQVFDFRPLKLGEMRAVLKALRLDDPVDQSLAVVAAALPDAGLTPEALADMTVPWYEIDEAVKTLLPLAGLRRPSAGEPAPGEAMPQAAPA